MCRRRPTLAVAAVPHGRHPQTFTFAEVKDPYIGVVDEILKMRF
jgi:hypothetical protein